MPIDPILPIPNRNNNPYTCKRIAVFKRHVGSGVICRYQCGPNPIDRLNNSADECPMIIPPGELVPGDPPPYPEKPSTPPISQCPFPKYT